MVESVVRECLEQLNRPITFEYDFRKHKNSPNLVCSLKSSTKIRYYQVIIKIVNKMINM